MPGSGQSVQYAALRERPDVPMVAVEAFELDVGGDQALTFERLTFEAEAERLANGAVSAVAADQESSADLFHGSIGVREHGLNEVRVLVERRERDAMFDSAAERPETRPQNLLGAPLRDHPEVRIGRVRGRCPLHRHSPERHRERAGVDSKARVESCPR